MRSKKSRSVSSTFLNDSSTKWTNLGGLENEGSTQTSSFRRMFVNWNVLLDDRPFSNEWPSIFRTSSSAPWTVQVGTCSKLNFNWTNLIQKGIKESVQILRREERTDEIAQLIRELNNYSKFYPTYEESSLQVGNMSNIPQYEEFKDLVAMYFQVKVSERCR